MAWPIEPTNEQRVTLGAELIEFLNAFIEDRGTAPASSGEPTPGLIEELMAPPPDGGIDLGVLLQMFSQSLDTGFDTASGRMFSYIPTGGLYSAALGNLLASGTNRWSGGAHAAPGAVAIEQGVVSWMVNLFGMPAGSSGILVSGGSVATLTAVVAARHRLGEKFSDGTIYTSDRAHHSLIKAARIAGISEQRIRLIPSDSRQRMDVTRLREAISEDLASGLRPMMVMPTAGTTDTGAIDPLKECAEVASEVGAWLHVDAAYGGFFQLTERGRSSLAGIEQADSITVDAHKSLMMPFGLGGLLVRDPQALIEAHSGRGVYMRDVSEGSLPHYLEMGPELTRPFRGLPIWLALNLHGVSQFREVLDRMLDLTLVALERLESMDNIELIGPPELSILAFRSSQGNEATQRILDSVNATKEIHLSSTEIDNKIWIRLALLSHRTHEAQVDRAMQLIEKANRG